MSTGIKLGLISSCNDPLLSSYEDLQHCLSSPASILPETCNDDAQHFLSTSAMDFESPPTSVLLEPSSPSSSAAPTMDFEPGLSAPALNFESPPKNSETAKNFESPPTSSVLHETSSSSAPAMDFEPGSSAPAMNFESPPKNSETAKNFESPPSKNSVPIKIFKSPPPRNSVPAKAFSCSRDAPGSRPIKIFNLPPPARIAPGSSSAPVRNNNNNNNNAPGSSSSAPARNAPGSSAPARNAPGSSAPARNAPGSSAPAPVSSSSQNIVVDDNYKYECYALYEATKRRVRMRMIVCDLCGIKVRVQNYAKHQKETHSIDPMLACVWCAGCYTFPRGTKMRHTRHLIACLRKKARHYPAVPRGPPPPPPVSRECQCTERLVRCLENRKVENEKQMQVCDAVIKCAELFKRDYFERRQLMINSIHDIRQQKKCTC